MVSRLRIVLAATLTFTACASTDEAPDFDEGVLPIAAGSPEAVGVLDLVNDPSTSFTLLDDTVGLDRRAAQNIVDDRPFDSLDALDRVKYVGPSAIEKLVDYARRDGRIVTPTGDDALILGVVNDPGLTLARLDDTIALDRRAAENIFAFRTGVDAILSTVDDRLFVTVAQLDGIAYVGASALAKILDHARQNTTSPDCLIISEYFEGPGTYNKAVEVHNCGLTPIALGTYGLCLVRNDDTSCGTHAKFADTTLDAGAVWLACRRNTRHPASNDPSPALEQFCQQEMSSIMTFDGNDRILLFEDQDNDGRFESGDRQVDSLGVLNQPAPDFPFENVLLRRCDFRAQTGTFDVGRFTTHSAGDVRNLGLAPTETCGPNAVAIGACQSSAECTTPERCTGVPNDGSTPYGVCVDTTPVNGEGAQCDQRTPCAAGTICAGTTLWGEGSCVAEWMATRVVHDDWNELADGATVTTFVVVNGLASVPVDITVTVRLEHSRATDLRVTLTDPNGDSALLWERSTELESGYARSFATNGISRDDSVNGRWTLTVEDLEAGAGAGWLRGWELFVVSRWD